MISSHRRGLARALAWIVGGLVAVPSVIALHTAHAVSLSVHYPAVPVDPADRARVRAEFPTIEDVEFRTSDGVRLRGWYLPSRNRAAVVLVHGGMNNRTQLLPELEILGHRGFGVLSYDSRASGESEGNLCTVGDRERRDVTAALDLVSARPDVDPTRIGLLGFSIGASAVALVASHDPRPRAVVLHAIWTTLEEEERDKWGHYGELSRLAALWTLRGLGIDVNAVRPIDRVGGISPRPLFMIAGAEDPDTPVSIMQRVFASAREPKSIWVVPGAKHGGYSEAAPEEYSRRLASFFEESLSASEARK